VVPMRNFQDDIIGVIQLINSKEDLTSREHNGNEAYSIKLGTEDDLISTWSHLMKSMTACSRP
jgi:hypothetical protein